MLDCRAADHSAIAWLALIISIVSAVISVLAFFRK